MKAGIPAIASIAAPKNMDQAVTNMGPRRDTIGFETKVYNTHMNEAPTIRRSPTIVPIPIVISVKLLLITTATPKNESNIPHQDKKLGRFPKNAEIRAANIGEVVIRTEAFDADVKFNP